MRNYDNKSKKLIFDNNFLNGLLSETMSGKGFKFCLDIPYLSGGNRVSDFLFYVLVFILCKKNGKHFAKFRKNIF